MTVVDRALIVGGGIAGMTLAAALADSDIAAEIIEIRSDWGDLGTGISLQGPALRALKTIGVLDDCVSRGFGYSQFTSCDAAGSVTGIVDLPRLLGDAYPATLGVMRHVLHEALAKRIGVPVRTGLTVAAMEDDGDAVSVTFSDGGRQRFDLVVGADGAHSRIRDLIFGPKTRPHYTGQVNWRATVRRPADVHGRHSYFGPTNKSGFNPVSEREMYIYIVQNVPERPRWPAEEWPGLMRGLLAEFGGALGNARDEIVSPEQIICRPVESGVLPAPWYRGRVVVIGDAAHTTSPHLASGATIAIEDAVVLAEMLCGDDPLPVALEQFMARRFDRCRMVVANSEQLGEWEKAPDTPGADPVALMAQSYRALAEPV